MSSPIGRVRCLFSAAVTTLMIGGMSVTALAGGDTASMAALKAAFILNFAKFSEWPADALAPGQQIMMCVVGDGAVSDALTDTIKGRTIEGHQLTVAVLKPDASAAGCHLLYVSTGDIKRSNTMLGSAKSAAVLTVSDADNFAESGGVAQLIVENDRMRFAINLDAAQRGHVRLSSKLLTLAKIVKDNGNAPR